MKKIIKKKQQMTSQEVGNRTIIKYIDNLKSIHKIKNLIVALIFKYAS